MMHAGLREVLAAAGFVLAALPIAGRAQDLYEARAIVTGTDLRSRGDGFEQCLRDVLVKASGDPALHDDRRVGPAVPDPAVLVQDFTYLDRLWTIPYHDEQGSRDRPFDLIVHFDPARIDALLASLGATPWRAERPAVVLLVTLHNGSDTTMVSADGDLSEKQREALEPAAQQYGMRAVLLSEAELQHGAARAASRFHDGVTLTGTLTWNEAAGGWVGDWHLSLRGTPHHWHISGVSLDDAFRDAMRGAMQILSGHGAPG